MTTEHPITPPLELVQQWANSSPLQHSDEWWAYELLIAHHAARWGADQELEACVEWAANTFPLGTAKNLRDARRPKLPSLAEQALNELDLVPTHDQDGRSIDADTSVIRRALERLQELEKGNE